MCGFTITLLPTLNTRRFAQTRVYLQARNSYHSAFFTRPACVTVVPTPIMAIFSFLRTNKAMENYPPDRFRLREDPTSSTVRRNSQCIRNEQGGTY